MNSVFKYIKASQFFPEYCPTVNSFKHKLRGRDGHGKAITFSAAELKLIRAGVKKMCQDLSGAPVIKAEATE